MPLEIVRNDITKMQVDAIVNSARRNLLGGGGADGAIHRAAGPRLVVECLRLGGCKVGQAKITQGYNLPCKYIIHTVGPKWHGGNMGEQDALIACYKNSLALAKEYGCKSVAFPLIAAGIYQYPKDQALRIAMDTIGAFLMENDMTVYLVVFDPEVFSISKKLFAAITDYLDDHYVEEYDEIGRAARRMSTCPEEGADLCPETASVCSAPAAPTEKRNLDELLQDLDAGFSETLLTLIDRSGKKDSQIYKKANVDRKLFSKIRSNPNYRPSKPTAIAFAIALELNLEETEDFIARAGYALSHSSKFDVIIQYFIEQEIYDILKINEALYAFDQSLLGA